MKPTQEQVIAWAREAQLIRKSAVVSMYGENTVLTPYIEAFAALAYEAGRKDENEACANELKGFWLNGRYLTDVADFIRARREQ